MYICVCDLIYIKDHFWQNICALSCAKGLLLIKASLKIVLYTYSYYTCTTIYSNFMYTKRFFEEEEEIPVLF